MRYGDMQVYLCWTCVQQQSQYRHMAPKIVSILTNIMKPFLSGKTTSSPRSKSSKNLLKNGKRLFWNTSILKSYLLATAEINMGGKVPKSYYLRYKTDTTNKKSLSIPKDSKKQLEIKVKETGAMLKYNSLSALKDIPYSR
ncbi:hypothetical protein DAPPUDRAFT_314177 [Daphnia pulex]|uniref:Uncharacterized protein n=1 Tax=Daphnia pulex TaxID=6669 RepID=E9G4W1_DAPPU|nr:hypothetical protein DAPPUDRAFT_314177 [Daphnia pulex]|eukprot:EFX85368.1 hypothetical protein DAPPUDRAFT_314177 [Daphnia pulex]